VQLASDGEVFIELTLGGKPVERTVVDRIILVDGLIRERRLGLLRRG
jgi:hypothetical protein